jgi:hypothetical protein
MTMCPTDKNIEKDSRHFEGSAPEIALVDGKYKAEWVDLGEGKDGDYDQNDPSDVALLRFDISLDGELVTGGSYCTLMPVDTPEQILRKGLERIMDAINDKCGQGDCCENCGKLFEELSWIEPKWFQ